MSFRTMPREIFRHSTARPAESGGLSCVEADVVAIGRVKLLVERALHLVDELEDGLVFLGGR